MSQSTTPIAPTILIMSAALGELRAAVENLQKAGLTVFVVEENMDICQRAQIARPHLILLDVQTASGWEICRRLKQNPKTQNIPVIVVLAAEIDPRQGFAVGAVDYVVKPVQREALLARIMPHLKVQALTRQLHQQQARLNPIDSMTTIANRQHFDQQLQQEWQRLVRSKEPLSLILCDIDYFRLYNEQYGHGAGDQCLKQIAQILDRVVKRPADVVARYGGEEFAILLPNVRMKGAVHIARLIQMEIRHLEIPHGQSQASTYVTLSLGISSRIPDGGQPAESLAIAANRALNQAKAQGRNTYALALAN